MFQILTKSLYVSYVTFIQLLFKLEGGLSRKLLSILPLQMATIVEAVVISPAGIRFRFH